MTEILTLFIAYSFRHPHFPTLHPCSCEEASTPRERSPTMLTSEEARIRSFGGMLESRPLSAQIHLTSELLRTLSRHGCF